MAILKVNGTTVSEKAIVAIYIDSDGRPIAATQLEAPVEILENQIGGSSTTVTRDSNEKYIECDLKVSLKPADTERAPQSMFLMRICYDRFGRVIPCP